MPKRKDNFKQYSVKVIENSLKHIVRPKALAVVVNSGGGYLV